jgi:hypothetical protein
MAKQRKKIVWSQFSVGLARRLAPIAVTNFSNICNPFTPHELAGNPLSAAAGFSALASDNEGRRRKRSRSDLTGNGLLTHLFPMWVLCFSGQI